MFDFYKLATAIQAIPVEMRDKLFDVVEDFTADTETKIDDSVFIPICKFARAATNTPDLPDKITNEGIAEYVRLIGAVATEAVDTGHKKDAIMGILQEISDHDGNEFKLAP